MPIEITTKFDGEKARKGWIIPSEPKGDMGQQHVYGEPMSHPAHIRAVAINYWIGTVLVPFLIALYSLALCNVSSEYQVAILVSSAFVYPLAVMVYYAIRLPLKLVYTPFRALYENCCKGKNHTIGSTLEVMGRDLGINIYRIVTAIFYEMRLKLVCLYAVFRNTAETGGLAIVKADRWGRNVPHDESIWIYCTPQKSFEFFGDVGSQAHNLRVFACLAEQAFVLDQGQLFLTVKTFSGRIAYQAREHAGNRFRQTAHIPAAQLHAAMAGYSS